MIYNINGKKVDLHQGIITDAECTLHIRAKTLNVLKVLIAQRNNIVSKQQLLETVWHDVVVQDQVLTQSIKEIRDLLGGHVIKTYPRQGYQWVACCEKEQSKNITQPFDKNTNILLAAFSVGVCVVLFSFINRANAPLKVAILPVNNAVHDIHHRQISLQGLEMMTEQLASTSQLSVLDSEHVLFAIERLSVSEYQQINQGDVFALRKKLDTDIIVQSKLTGFPHDLQLHYILHFSSHLQRGVLMGKTKAQLFNDLVALIATQFDQYTPKNTEHNKHFSNEAFARAVASYLTREFKKAIPLLEAVLVTEPNHLAARRYLAASYANTGKYRLAIDLLKSNIAFIEQGQKEEKREGLRAYLMIGYIQLNWPIDSNREQELLSAEFHINRAKDIAKKQQDELFIAYSLEELGKTKRLQGEYEIAKKLLEQALEYHNRFLGNYGQTATLIELANVAYAQGAFSQANIYLQQAQKIANDNKAAANQVWVLLARADIAKRRLNNEQAQILANQAKVIANNSNDPHLINRVTAWFSDKSAYTVN